jgi:hypothetical protein
VDIGAPANAIEYHPALLAHADENAATTTAPPVAAAAAITTPPTAETIEVVKLTPPALDLASSDGGGSISGGSDNDDDLDDLDDIDDDDDDDDLEDNDDDESMFSSEDDDESDDFTCMSPGHRAENEKFGPEYEGPKLNDRDARRLLTLMLHASTCQCRYVLTKGFFDAMTFVGTKVSRFPPFLSHVFPPSLFHVVRILQA